jgi:hypothetical protein
MIIGKGGIFFACSSGDNSVEWLRPFRREADGSTDATEGTDADDLSDVDNPPDAPESSAGREPAPERDKPESEEGSCTEPGQELVPAAPDPKSSIMAWVGAAADWAKKLT